MNKKENSVIKVNEIITQIISILNEEKDQERAESFILSIISGEGVYEAWLILALISLKRHEFTIVGTCLKHILRDKKFEECIVDLIKMASSLSDFMSSDYLVIESLAEGFLRENSYISNLSVEDIEFLRKNTELMI